MTTKANSDERKQFRLCTLHYDYLGVGEESTNTCKHNPLQINPTLEFNAFSLIFPCSVLSANTK